MTQGELARTRVALVQAFLQDKGYDGILLSRVDNFAMVTGGRRNYVNIMGETGVFSLFVTRDGRLYCIANSIEAPRAIEEELEGYHVELRTFLWFDGSAAAVVNREFTGNLVSDDGSLGSNVNSDLALIRSLLTPAELEKYRRLGKLAADAMTATLAAVEPNMPERAIAARLVAEGEKRGCLVPVSLIAADARIAKFRHPLPTEMPLLDGPMTELRVKGYVMVVGCFQREGLVVSLTRFKRVGDLPVGIEDAYARVAGVDALMQEATRPGTTLGDVFAACQKGYAALGFPENEWHRHHQGGTTGYGARTAKGVPGETFPILGGDWAERVASIAGIATSFGQAFAWNPSAVGVKSEDTFILNADGTKEIVTSTPSLPSVDLESVLGRPTTVVKSGIA